MKYKNLEIIGTSHIAKQSLNDVKDAIEEGKPEIIAIELDAKRMLALLSKKKAKISIKDVFRIGIKGWLFMLLGAWAEKKLGEMTGVSPGSEMITAVKLAKKNKILVKLIDQDIQITLKRLSKAITWKEKWRFVVDIVKAVIFRRPEVQFDLTKVPSEQIIKKLIMKTKIRYPNFYKVLIKERNEFMAKKLALVMDANQDKKILAIVGAGHEKEMITLVKDKLKNMDKITYVYGVGA